MKNKKVLLIVLVLAAVSAGLTARRISSRRFVPKLQNEKQVIAYQDSGKVELYYHNPEDSAPVEIRIYIWAVDGSDEVARALVQPNETVTILEGENVPRWRSGFYGGRILVFDSESGRLKERIEPLEFRLYESSKDAYDSLVPPADTERKLVLEEKEHRIEKMQMSVNLKTEEIRAGINGLCAERRELNSYIYAEIDGEERLIAKSEHIAPNSIIFDIYLEPGIAGLLHEGDVILNAHTDSYYTDSGEFYDSIPTEIIYVYRSE